MEHQNNIGKVINSKNINEFTKSQEYKVIEAIANDPYNWLFSDVYDDMEETRLKTTDDLQQFLRTTTATDEGWIKVHEAMTSYYLRCPFVYSVRPEHTHWIVCISYAFSKYSYYGAPYEWRGEDLGPQCEVVHGWALWAWEQYMFHGVFYPLEKMVQEYDMGLIPDCQDVMFDLMKKTQ